MELAIRERKGPKQTHEVDRLDPVVLVWCHIQLLEDICGLADLKDFDGSSIGVVNLH